MIFHVILALSMLKDDREDQSIMLIFGKKKKKKTLQTKKWPLITQDCCRVAAFSCSFIFYIMQRSLLHSTSLIPVRSLIHSQQAERQQISLLPQKCIQRLDHSAD